MTLEETQGTYSPAVTPVAETTQATGFEGITAGHTKIRSKGSELPIYVAKPAEYEGLLPIVLVVQEIFGVHEHIQDVCRRLAKEGYLAIAPELYFRQGDAQQYSDIQELLTKLVSKVPDNQVLSDLDHAAHWAGRHDGDITKLAITGFCWGGRITWLYAAHNPQLKAGVAWYGRLVGDKTLTSPKHPLDIADKPSAPVLGLYGGQDHGIPLDGVEAMNKALAAAGKNSHIHVYPEAGHAFNADYRPSYHAESAADGWQRMLDWFAAQGVSAAK